MQPTSQPGDKKGLVWFPSRIREPSQTKSFPPLPVLEGTWRIPTRMLSECGVPHIHGPIL